MDSDWSSDLEDSQLSGGSASLTDDSGGSGPAAAAGARRAAAARRQRGESPAKAPRLDTTSYITSQAQLKVGQAAGAAGSAREVCKSKGASKPCTWRCLHHLTLSTTPLAWLPSQDLGSTDLSAIAAAWFPAATDAAAFFPGASGTLRLKSRKPVVVAMSAVW